MMKSSLVKLNFLLYNKNILRRTNQEEIISENKEEICNIYKELEDDVGFEIPSHGELTSWAKQGVLLLNTVLTVREAQPNSHKGKGWEIFTDRVIAELNKKQTPVVFLLWGANAKNKARLINNPLHIKLETVHPSPLSAYGGFFGCKHFSKTNEILLNSNQTPINWQI